MCVDSESSVRISATPLESVLNNRGSENKHSLNVAFQYKVAVHHRVATGMDGPIPEVSEVPPAIISPHVICFG